MKLHPALEAIRDATISTSFEGDLWVVGGAVRDVFLNVAPKADFDLVTRGSAADLAHLLYDHKLASFSPVTYERFGTAMVVVKGVSIELVTARRESYLANSRKPIVEAASYEEDASRRDFTINTLMVNLHSRQLRDPLGIGLSDLQARVLRTPLDPIDTFNDDPLRMLRAVRFRWRFQLEPVIGLYDAIRTCRDRLRIVSAERIRDEFIKILGHPSAPEALADLMDLGLIEVFAPEFTPMVGCEQGKYHYLDVWKHSLEVVRNVGSDDLSLTLGALFHDIGKPPTRSLDKEGNTRFLGHEAVGAEMTQTVMRNLKFSQREIEKVAVLVKNHMRLGSAPVFTASAARRVLRDLGDQTEELLKLVEADTLALKPGVKVMELDSIRKQIEAVQVATPISALESPLSGEEIMEITGFSPGREIGRLKGILLDQVLDGKLDPGDKLAAKEVVLVSLQVISESDHPRH